MELTSVVPSEITFKEKLASSQAAEIFLVVIRDKTCAMKVHHGRGPKEEWERLWPREKNIFVCESTAYRRLAKAGICARGITPQFYGTVENINPTHCMPYLEAFVKDEYPPTAILLEYIPNMQAIHWSNYNPKRMQNFIHGLNEIHSALVEHGDPHPRNMMIVDGDPERAIWIDFDRAQTFSGELDERQTRWVAEEKGIVAEMDEFMRHDAMERKMDKTLQYYY